MTGNLFDPPDETAVRVERLGAGTVLLHRFVLAEAEAVRNDVAAVMHAAPLRHMQTPGGYRMSVAMTNCGRFGWVSDAQGYRYDLTDPLTGQPWPALPPRFLAIAQRAAAAAGFSGFMPDACLINRYEPGTRLSLHQDKNERDLSAPIVSVSLGLPAVFLWGRLSRADKTTRLLLRHGDTLVWGGPDRLRYHGIMPLVQQEGHQIDTCRINLTFRQAG